MPNNQDQDQPTPQLTPAQIQQRQTREECLTRYFVDIVQFHRDRMMSLLQELNPSEISTICAYIMAFVDTTRPGMIEEVFVKALARFRKGAPILIGKYIEENGPLPEDACPVIFPYFPDFSGDRPNIKLYLGEPETTTKQ